VVPYTGSCVEVTGGSRLVIARLTIRLPLRSSIQNDQIGASINYCDAGSIRMHNGGYRTLALSRPSLRVAVILSPERPCTRMHKPR
jgi:hypothetical protein